MPQRYQDDLTLGRWVICQGQSLKTNTLKPDHVACLDVIGFHADPLTNHWNEKCSKSEAYHAKYGHCNVPVKYQADHVLGTWVRVQRRSIKNNKLKLEYVASLSAIGFQADFLAY